MNFSKLKAIVYTKYRDPEVLRIREIEKPYPKDDEVLVKIHAVSINDWDFGLLHGDFINRLLNGLLKPKVFLYCEFSPVLNKITSQHSIRKYTIPLLY